MRSESFVVAEMLQRMERQNQLLRPHASELAAALSKDEYPMALELTAELHRVLEALVMTTDVLKNHVVARDGMGEMGESLGELALRARTLVLTAQLDLLREELCDPGTQTRSRAWFAGRFQNMADVDAFIRERLDQIHRLWLPYRHDQQQPTGMTDADRANVYRTMIRVAQRALQALRDDPDLAEFLDHGLAAVDLVQIHLACREMVAALGLQLDAEPARAALRRSRRIARSVSSAVPSGAVGTPLPDRGATEGT